MDVPDLSNLGKVIKSWTQYLKKYYPEFLEFITKKYKLPVIECLFLYKYGLNSPPVCPSCGKPVRFINANIGYRKFCSVTCASNSNDVKTRREKKCLEKYGVRNPFQNKDIKQKIKETNRQKYGCDYPMQNPNIRDKFYDSMVEKYGVEHALQNNDILEKMYSTTEKRYGDKINMRNQKILEKLFETNMEKYGCKVPLQNKNIKDKMHQKFLKENPLIIDENEEEYICQCPHVNCMKCEEKEFHIEKNIYSNRKYQGTELCTKLVASGQISDTTIEIFTRNILDELDQVYDTNIRTILGHQELDLYMRVHKMAIECNGIYWHSLKKPDYHYKKWKSCYEKGIELITLWEDQFRYHPESVIDFIKLKLCVKKYHDLMWREIPNNKSSKKRRSFIEFISDDLTGYGRNNIGTYKIGIYDGDDLIAGISIKTSGNIYTINRVRVLPGYNILPVLSEIISSLPGEVNYIYHNDIPWISIDSLYDLGFVEIERKPPIGWVFDKNLNRKPLYSGEGLRIFDSGSLIFKLKKY